MYNDPQRPPFNPLKIIILMVIAIIIVIGATYTLNGGGGTATGTSDNSSNNTTDNATSLTVQPTMIGNSSQGVVYKYSSYGNTASNVKVALVIGIDEDPSQAESVLPTLENAENLQYSYDVYLVNATDSNNTDNNTNSTNDTDSNLTDDTNSSSNSSTRSNSEALAREYVVKDIVNGNYDFTAEIHSSSNGSFLFVPSDDTYTSKEVVNSIANATGIKKQTPANYNFAKGASIPLIENNVPSMVYMTTTYYSSEPSDDIMQVIGAIDNFDFNALYASDMTTSNNTTSSNNSSSNTTNNSSNHTTSNRMKVSNEVD